MLVISVFRQWNLWYSWKLIQFHKQKWSTEESRQIYSQQQQQLQQLQQKCRRYGNDWGRSINKHQRHTIHNINFNMLEIKLFSFSRWNSHNSVYYSQMDLLPAVSKQKSRPPEYFRFNFGFSRSFELDPPSPFLLRVCVQLFPFITHSKTIKTNDRLHGQERQERGRETEKKHTAQNNNIYFGK